MIQNLNADFLKSFYERFSNGDMKGVLELCPAEISFQIPGKSKLAGKYNKETLVPQLIGKIMELSSGTFKMEVHDIMASDLHGLVLTTDTVTLNGMKHEYRTVHVWRFQSGKPVAWYEYPRDLYQYDAVWS